jgi:hypothetical protein
MNILDQANAELDHLRAELLVTQQLTAELLEALQAVARADTLDAAQQIACAAIAFAIAKGDPFTTHEALAGRAP